MTLTGTVNTINHPLFLNRYNGYLMQTMPVQPKPHSDKDVYDIQSRKSMNKTAKVLAGIGIIGAIALGIYALIRKRGSKTINNVINKTGQSGERVSNKGAGVPVSSSVPPKNTPKINQKQPNAGEKGTANPVSKPKNEPKTPPTETPKKPENPKNITPDNTALTAQKIAERQKSNCDKLERLHKEHNCSYGGTIYGKWLKLQEVFYDKIRGVTVPYSGGEATIKNITGQETSKIYAFDSHGWHYRGPKGTKGMANSDVVERISLNVKPAEKLIKTLDNFIDTHKNLKINYKTPNDYKGWLDRHDPITIYFGEKAVTPEILNEISEIAKPYARETGTSVLRGKLFGECCAWQRNATEADKRALINRAKNIFGSKLTEHNAENIFIRNEWSAGEFCAFNDVLNAITGEKLEVLMPN